VEQQVIKKGLLIQQAFSIYFISKSKHKPASHTMCMMMQMVDVLNVIHIK